MKFFTHNVKTFAGMYLDRETLGSVARTQKYKDLVLPATKFLPKTAVTAQRFWHIWNDQTSIPICPMCDNNLKWQVKSYSKNCSQKCSGLNPNTKSSRAKTNKKVFGFEFASQNPDTQVKKEETNLKKYGERHTLQVKKFKDKQEASTKKVTGAKNAFASKRIQEEIKQIHVKKAGKGRYNPQQNPETKAKTLATKAKIGYKKTVAKRKASAQKAVDRDNYSQAHIPKKSLKLLESKSWLKDQHYTKQLTYEEIADTLGTSPHKVYTSIRDCGLTGQYFLQSSPERKILDLIQSIYDGEVIINTRSTISPYELDIYLPDLNLAIEYHGLFWHSEAQKPDTRYHRKKLDLCTKVDVRLIQIFESEWLNPITQKIVYSRIRSALGESKRIGARKCEVRKVGKDTAKRFLTKNHIQGFTPAKLSYGLVYEGKVVALMTFGKPRFNTNYDWELLRFCNRLGYTVQGGASRLFKHFQSRNDGSLLSYCDLRWGTGAMYEQIGLKFSHRSDPNFWYFDNSGVLLSRQRFQKHKLPDLLEAYDPSLTAYLNMLNHGFHRIWDCGSNVYTT